MQIGWVDFSEEERSRANLVLEMAKGKGAIDELGLGVLRDSFSSRLFPGTSTLHTHARYYFLTAYLMKGLASRFQGAGRERVNREFESGEKHIAQRLSDWCDANEADKEGITGINFINGDTWVKQKPSSMNWSAMREYGLLKDEGATLSSYLSMVASPARQLVRADAEGDDASLLVSPAEAIWSVPYEGYASWLQPGPLSVGLLPCEGQVLYDAICRRFPDSLYAAMLQAPESLDLCAGFRSFVELSDNIESLLPGFNDVAALELAADLSSLAALLHIRFNYVLRHFDDGEDDETEKLWGEAYAGGARYYARALRCDVAACYVLLGVSATGPNGQTLSFLRDAQKVLRRGILEELDELIKRRELQLKGRSRSKILNASAYRGDWYGGTELTYRLSTALGLAKEITSSIEGSAS